MQASCSQSWPTDGPSVKVSVDQTSPDGMEQRAPTRDRQAGPQTYVSGPYSSAAHMAVPTSTSQNYMKAAWPFAVQQLKKKGGFFLSHKYKFILRG